MRRTTLTPRRLRRLVSPQVEMKHYAVYQVEDCGAVPTGHGPGIPLGLPPCSRMKFDANVSAARPAKTRVALQMPGGHYEES